MKKINESLCSEGYEDLESDLYENLPKAIVFYFDGMGDFNAKDAKSFGAQNLDGTEGNDLGMGNANGLRSLKNVFGSYYYNTSELKNMWKKYVAFNYYSSSGLHSKENFKSAINCYEEISKYLKLIKKIDKERILPKIVVMGYSNGAYNTLDFQLIASEKFYPIDLVVTVDPIEQALTFPLGKLKSFRGSKSKYPKKLINFYQTDDYGSLPVLRLTGRPVKNTKYNFKMDSTIDSIMSDDGRKNHIYILNTSLYEKALRCEFQKILIPFSEECTYEIN